MEELAWDDNDVFSDQDELQESAKEIALVNDVFINQDESQLFAKEVALVDDVFMDQGELKPLKEVEEVSDVINSVLEAAVAIAKQPEVACSDSEWLMDATKDKRCPSIGPYLSASKSKDEEWLEQMLLTIEGLEIKYAPHPLPYEGSDGFIHSADVHPPHVDFHALGFSSRRLPTPELHPIQSCSPDPDFYTGDFKCAQDCPCRKTLQRMFYSTLLEGTPAHAEYQNAAACGKSRFGKPLPFGTLPGLLTNCGVIAVPPQLFGFQHKSGTAGINTTWMMCATETKLGFSSSKSASSQASKATLGGRYDHCRGLFYSNSSS